MSKPHVIVYTDGACSGNPGPGGWACVLKMGEHVREIWDGSDLTTNNQMELEACLAALRALTRPCKVTLFTDSAYIVNCYKDGWALKWVRNDWRNSKDDVVANRELWEELFRLAGYPGLKEGVHEVSFAKVQGHAGVELNERCDELARQERDRRKEQVKAQASLKQAAVQPA